MYACVVAAHTFVEEQQEAGLGIREKDAWKSLEWSSAMGTLVRGPHEGRLLLLPEICISDREWEGHHIGV